MIYRGREYARCKSYSPDVGYKEEGGKRDSQVKVAPVPDEVGKQRQHDGAAGPKQFQRDARNHTVGRTYQLHNWNEQLIDWLIDWLID